MRRQASAIRSAQSLFEILTFGGVLVSRRGLVIKIMGCYGSGGKGSPSAFGPRLGRSEHRARLCWGRGEFVEGFVDCTPGLLGGAADHDQPTGVCEAVLDRFGLGGRYRVCAYLDTDPLLRLEHGDRDWRSRDGGGRLAMQTRYWDVEGEHGGRPAVGDPGYLSVGGDGGESLLELVERPANMEGHGSVSLADLTWAVKRHAPDRISDEPGQRCHSQLLYFVA